MCVYALPFPAFHFDLQFDLDQTPTAPSIDQPGLTREPAFYGFFKQALHVVEWEELTGEIRDFELQFVTVVKAERHHRVVCRVRHQLKHYCIRI